MKTKLSMNMPEALEAYDTEITAVAMLSESEYQSLLADGSLPERYHDRLKDYTDALTATPRSCLITGYKAMLALTKNGEHGVAVCGGDGGVYRAGLFPNAREWLDGRITRMANFICGLSHVPNAKNPRQIDLKSLNTIFDCTVTADNGIGELLLRELKAREEIAEVILCEDCMQINYALDYGQIAIDSPGDFLTLAGLIGCDLEDFHLLHTDEDHDVATIVELNKDTLTDEGKKDWADVLDAKVERIYNGYYGIQADVSGCEADRLRDFSFMLAGDCPVSDYDRWVNADEEQDQTDAPDEDESSGMTMQ